jgi:hypothetical protein
MPAPAAPAPAVGKQTVKGHLEGPLPPMPVAAAPAPVAEPRRRTGTPQVGVPVSHDPYAAPAMPAPVEQAPVTGLIEPRSKTPTAPPPVESPSGAIDVAPSGRARRASAAGPSESAAWFEEGEQASEAAEAVRARKLISPSTTDLSIYDESMMRRRRWPLVVGVLALLGLVGGAIALTRGGDEAAPKQTAEVTPPPAPPPAEVPPSQIITPTPPPAEPVDARTQPAKKQEAKPAKKEPTSHKVAKATPKAVNNDSDDTASRRPGGDWFGPSTTTTNATTTAPPTTTVVTPPTNTTTGPTGVSGAGGPEDPYGPSPETPSADGADKKAEFYANVGQQQLASGDTAGAAASFKKALEIDPKHAGATTGMGEIALRQGLFGDAIAHLKKAARLAPRSSRVFTLLGEAYLNSGNNRTAADNFKKALQLDPDNVRAREGFNEASAKVPPPEDEL